MVIIVDRIFRVWLCYDVFLVLYNMKVIKEIFKVKIYGFFKLNFED